MEQPNNLTTKKIPFCIKCFSIPVITIDKNNDIHIMCNCDKELTLEQHLNQLITNSDKCDNHPDIPSVEYCIECQKSLCSDCVNYHNSYIESQHHLIHQNNIIIHPCSIHEEREKEFYCQKCNEYLCSECCETHNPEHKIISLSAILEKINIEVLKDKIKQGEKYLDEYYPEIQYNYITEINQKYEYNLNRNKNILKLYSIMINNYIPNKIIDYNLIRNIYNIHLTLEKYNQEESYLEFLKSNSIIYSDNEPIYRFGLINLHCIKTIKEHTELISSLVVLSDGRLASCSTDKTIKIYNPKQDYKCDLTIKEHMGAVFTLCVLEDGRLVSGSGNPDRKILIWNISDNSFNKIATLLGHTDWVTKVIALPSNRIASSSDDQTIRIWSTDPPYKCITTLKAHKSYVWSLVLMKHEKYMISGSWDNTLRVWDVNTYNNEKTIKDVYCRFENSLIVIDENRVAVGGESIVKIVNITTEEIEDKIEAGKEIYSLLLLRDGNLLFGDTTGAIFHYPMKTKKVSRKENCHESFINCLIYLNDYIIVSASEDSTIKIWNS